VEGPLTRAAALLLLLTGSVALADTAAPEERALVDDARAIARAIDARDFDVLVRYVDERGVAFAPYRCADGLTIARDDVPSLLMETRVRRWGAYDGSGQPIRLRFSRYFERFVGDRRFAAVTPTVVRDDTRCAPKAKNARVVRFHVGGERWRDLYLTLVPGAGGFRLVRIEHDEWTI
jgi:hypothetical protein